VAEWAAEQEAKQGAKEAKEAHEAKRAAERKAKKESKQEVGQVAKRACEANRAKPIKRRRITPSEEAALLEAVAAFRRRAAAAVPAASIPASDGGSGPGALVSLPAELSMAAAGVDWDTVRRDCASSGAPSLAEKWTAAELKDKWKASAARHRKTPHKSEAPKRQQGGAPAFSSAGPTLSQSPEQDAKRAAIAATTAAVHRAL